MSDRIKEAREKFPAIADLWDWSADYKKDPIFFPWDFFRDLIGHSEDRYGEETGCRIPSCATELSLLGRALLCYEKHGHDVIYDAVDAMMTELDAD